MDEDLDEDDVGARPASINRFESTGSVAMPSSTALTRRNNNSSSSTLVGNTPNTSVRLERLTGDTHDLVAAAREKRSRLRGVFEILVRFFPACHFPSLLLSIPFLSVYLQAL